jgi:hypothetical protein
MIQLTPQMRILVGVEAVDFRKGIDGLARASHVLGRMAALVPAEWQRLYGHPIYFLETFIDPARFRGTCYRAANWRVLGRTTGRGHNAPTTLPTRPVKEVLAYPLVPDFRARLTRLTP